MADIKISDLTAAGTLTGTEEVPIVQSSTTVKATAQDIADLAAGGTNIGTSNLTITDATRKLIMQGSTSGETFSIRDTGDTTNLWSIDGGGVVTFNEAFSFPTTDGTANQVLQTDGAGAVTWATAGGGGSNIATSDLTISATGVRKLQMFDALSSSAFTLRNSADTQNLFSFGADGTNTIGLQSSNTGTNSQRNIVIGNEANNGGFTFTTAIGYRATNTSNNGVALGYNTTAGLAAIAIGLNADASAGQYNTSIGENAVCAGFMSVAIGRYASAQNASVVVGGMSSNSNVNCVSVGYRAETQHYSTALGYQAKANNQMALAIGASADVTGWSSGLISMSASPRTNTVQQTLAVNFGLTDHTWRIGHTADQWNMGSGSFGYGTMTPDASAVIDLTSTTKGFLPPRMTTTERDAISTPAEGLVIYNTTTQVLNFYNGSSWGAV